jgi:hypothetical protein
MSIYRDFKRSPRSDVHHVAEHVTKPLNEGETISPPPAPRDWTTARKARPADTLFPATLRWIDALPEEVRPHALSRAFPRIANMLARLWPNAAAFSDYMNDLLVDRRGGRKGFPLQILADLNRLRAHYGTLNPDQIAVWGDSGQPR